MNHSYSLDFFIVSVMFMIIGPVLDVLPLFYLGSLILAAIGVRYAILMISDLADVRRSKSVRNVSDTTVLLVEFIILAWLGTGLVAFGVLYVLSVSMIGILMLVIVIIPNLSMRS